ncbi:MAG: hypothetical protein ABUS47_10420 [Steroidobacter sp.]
MNKAIATVYGVLAVAFSSVFRSGHFNFFGLVLFVAVVVSAVGLWLRKKWSRYILLAMAVPFTAAWALGLWQLYRSGWAPQNLAWKTVSLSSTAIVLFVLVSTVYAFTSLVSRAQSSNADESSKQI